MHDVTMYIAYIKLIKYINNLAVFITYFSVFNKSSFAADITFILWNLCYRLRRPLVQKQEEFDCS